MLTLDKNGNYKSSYQHNIDSEPARTVGTISSEQYDTHIEERLNYWENKVIEWRWSLD